jgi:phosphoketolase
MKPASSGTYHIAYKWLSYALLLAVIYYWIFTIGAVYFNKPLNAATPRQALLYRTFARQNWRLFAVSKVYNRQMLFVTRDIKNPANSDTTDLEQYLLAEKRAYAPFNNYEDALDRILYSVMNGVESRGYRERPIIEKKFPGQPAAFYLQQTSAFIEADTAHMQDLYNIKAFAKYILDEKKLAD